MSSDAAPATDPTPPPHEGEVDEEQKFGTVHWEPLNDTKRTMVPEESPPMRRAARSPHNRNLSTSVYNFDQDAYDAIEHGASSAATRPPSYSRSTSIENPTLLETPWNSSSSVLGATTHSASASTKSKGKKSKETPLIPAAQYSEDADSGERIRLGICAMDKKARSKPMAEILSRLDEKDFQVVFFGDDTILNRPVEEWPICDVVIAFFSKGYPLSKAKEYVALRKPFILNDLERQELLQDRRKVYDLLEASGIDVPRHVYVSRDGYKSTGTGDGNGQGDADLQEFDDHIEVNGVQIQKPFVEKPVDAEDHNIAIYYPTSAGGGCKKLFRKIGNRSSDFYPEINEVRREGSYIYEEFVETQGTDVKMYTVGPEYGHAEARKSPTVDGKVERNSDGKEVRFPVILTYREKEIARRIVLVFQQFVCGFDILRVQEGHSVVSYVCDVNGWSFVKNSRKYYDDCAQILSEHVCAMLKPTALRTFSTLDPLVMTSMNRLDDEMTDAGDASVVAPAPAAKMNNILSRAARLLQGDTGDEESDNDDDNRTVNTMNDMDAMSVHSQHDAYPTNLSPGRSDVGENLTTGNTAATTLEEGALPVREFPNNLTSEPASMVQSSNSSVVEELDPRPPRRKRSSSIQQSHQEELRCVIAIVRHGDRTPKQKLKMNMDHPLILEYFHAHSKDCAKELKVKAKAPLTEFLTTIKKIIKEVKEDESAEDLRYQLMHMRDILERWKIVGLNRKLQIKPRKFEEIEDTQTGETIRRCTEVQLILKWGGNLTKLGEKQAIQLGHRHRHDLYPDASGGGILRLHSTFRHDLKIKTSDEGRVMKTAAAFAKGLLELEGDLPPILVSLVHKEKGSMHMLDPSGNKEVKKELDECKEKITANLQRDVDVRTAKEDELYQLVGPRELSSLRSALYEIGNPRKVLVEIHESMGELLAQLEAMLEEMGSGDEKRIEGGEGLQGPENDDVALSGVKLYKGETLLELTERWRFIYERLYDREKDQFDLSRIPDVHDNVRFDVLHNPHLGLSNTLQKLYRNAKLMADCVVPQEYGTTVAEKRSVGLKICHGLLEKIAYDLQTAREDDSSLDIRYLINYEYSKDLNINSMGRRIRTRLYFTSESHLHTVLNVFRFAEMGNGKRSLLSQHGKSIVNSTPELCYLTQVVLRVFEDNRRPVDDPRRFRIEIFFSPGATATPMHMNELDREQDQSRFDTAPLQLISRDGLTCQDVEEFFEQAIVAGRSDEESFEIASTSTAAEGSKKPKKKPKSTEVPENEEESGMTEHGQSSPGGTPVPPDPVPLDATRRSSSDEIMPTLPAVVETNLPPLVEDLSVAPDHLGSEPPVHHSSHMTDNTDLTSKQEDISAQDTVRAKNDSQYKSPGNLLDIFPTSVLVHNNRKQLVENGDERKRQENGSPLDDTSDREFNDWDRNVSENKDDNRVERSVSRKYFWGTVAVTSLGIGISCIAMALTMSEGRRNRRWSNRKY